MPFVASPRRSAVLAALAVGVSAAHAAGADQRDDVAVGGFTLRPLANLTYLDDRLEVHPKALVGVSWNSDPLGAAGPSPADEAARAIVGTDLRYHLDEMQELRFAGEIERRQWRDTDQLDLTGGVGRLGWLREGPRLESEVTAQYLLTDEALIETGEPVPHTDAELDARAVWRAAWWSFAGRAEAERVDYLEASSFFTARERDYDRFALEGLFGLDRARDTGWTMRVRGESLTYAVDTRYRDSTALTLLVGWRQLIETRSDLAAEVGVEWRRYDAGSSAQTARGETVAAPAAALGWDWSWEPGSQVGVRGFSRIEDSVTGTAGWVYGLYVDGRWRLRVNAYLFGNLGVDRLRGLTEDNLGRHEDRTTLHGQVGVAYFLREGVGARLYGGYTRSEADLSADYRQALVALEFAVGL